jgi:hypothetical protein
MSDGQVSKHFERSTKQERVAGVISILAVMGLIVLCGALSSHWQGSQPTPVSGAIDDSFYRLDFSRGFPSTVEKTERTLFPYSVIPGGAKDSHELLEAERREPVVAAHYAGFAASKTRIVRLAHDRGAYVSYRLGNRIYWTKKKVTLREGETLLSDGEHLARTRCGNRLSDVPMAPTSPQEPTEKVWNTPIVPLPVDSVPVSFPDGPQWPEWTSAAILLSPHSVPPTSGQGFPPFIPAFCCRSSSSSSPTPSKPGYPFPPPGYPFAYPTATPEPQTLPFLLLGLLFGALLLVRRYR